MSATPSPYPESQYTPATHPWRGQTFVAWPPGIYQIDGRPYCPTAWILSRKGGGENVSVFNTFAQCEARVAEVGGTLILSGSNTPDQPTAGTPDGTQSP